MGTMVMKSGEVWQRAPSRLDTVGHSGAIAHHPHSIDQSPFRTNQQRLKQSSISSSKKLGIYDMQLKL
jgi:hypothetical protein